MPSLRARQPGKALWTIFSIATTPIRIAFILIYYIPRFLRQHPTWTYHQAVGKAIFQLWWEYTSAVEFRTSKSLDPGSDKERFVVMQPAKPEWYRDILDDPKMHPVEIGGMWYPKLYAPAQDAGKKIVLHFHGGAYVLGGCRPMESGWGPEVLAKHTSGLVFCPQYRLAVYPHSHFPAAIQDGVTSYAYLLSQGIPASDIVISGDSAGGNLVIAMLRYLAEHEPMIPEPRAALLWSPWLNPAVEPEALDRHRNSKTDYLGSGLARWAVSSYTPPGVSPGHPYISPLGNEFATKVPIFVQTGTLEILYDDHVQFAKAMKEVPGNRVELFEIADAPHDTFAAGLLLGFVKEAEHAADVAAKFIETAKA